jgi:hypothetical protein
MHASILSVPIGKSAGSRRNVEHPQRGANTFSSRCRNRLYGAAQNLSDPQREIRIVSTADGHSLDHESFRYRISELLFMPS